MLFPSNYIYSLVLLRKTSTLICLSRILKHIFLIIFLSVYKQCTVKNSYHIVYLYSLFKIHLFASLGNCSPISSRFPSMFVALVILQYTKLLIQVWLVKSFSNQSSATHQCPIDVVDSLIHTARLTCAMCIVTDLH